MIVPLDRAIYDSETVRYAACILQALNICVQDLEQYYENVMSNKQISPEVSNGRFPRILKDIMLLQYKERLPGTCLWLADMTDNNNQRIIVKFTCQYSEVAHRKCAELGIAPILFLSHNIGYGWWIVLMEYLEGFTPLHKLENDVLIATETAVMLAVQKLHGAGLVHGDLRSPNILWKDGQVKFVDFDWAGVNGDATYPTSMNPNINWAPGVGLCKHIKPEHDIYMVESIYKEVSHTKQNLSEWNPLYIIKHYQHT